MDGTDADAAFASANCLVACTTGDTTPLPDTDVDTGTLPTITGLFHYVLFGYDPATDVARTYFSNGTPIEASLGFFFFDENYATSGDIADGCTVFLRVNQAPRATWAGRGSGYLFGMDFDPSTATVESNCDSHYGSGATQGLFDSIVDTGVWSVGLTASVDAGTAATLQGAGQNTANFLGATYTTTSDVVGTNSWFGYSYITAVDANWDVSPGGAAVSYLTGAQAVQARSNPSIPTNQTPVRAAYDVETLTQFLFQ